MSRQPRSDTADVRRSGPWDDEIAGPDSDLYEAFFNPVAPNRTPLEAMLLSQQAREEFFKSLVFTQGFDATRKACRINTVTNQRVCGQAWFWLAGLKELYGLSQFPHSMAERIIYISQMLAHLRARAHNSTVARNGAGLVSVPRVETHDEINARSNARDIGYRAAFAEVWSMVQHVDRTQFDFSNLPTAIADDGSYRKTFELLVAAVQEPVYTTTSYPQRLKTVELLNIAYSSSTWGGADNVAKGIRDTLRSLSSVRTEDAKFHAVIHAVRGGDGPVYVEPLLASALRELTPNTDVRTETLSLQAAAFATVRVSSPWFDVILRNPHSLFLLSGDGERHAMVNLDAGNLVELPTPVAGVTIHVANRFLVGRLASFSEFLGAHADVIETIDTADALAVAANLRAAAGRAINIPSTIRGYTRSAILWAAQPGSDVFEFNTETPGRTRSRTLLTASPTLALDAVQSLSGDIRPSGDTQTLPRLFTSNGLRRMLAQFTNEDSPFRGGLTVSYARAFFDRNGWEYIALPKSVFFYTDGVFN